MVSRKKVTKKGKKKPINEVRMRVKVSPRLLWVVPYLKKAKAKMPSLTLPTQVRSFKPTKTRIMRILGNVYFETKIIVLATHTQQLFETKSGKTRVKRIISIPRSEILDTLAHELAHLRHPDHNYEHEEYTGTIFKTFGLTQKCPTCKGTGKVALERKP